MNKRKLKKQLQYKIADAVEGVMITSKKGTEKADAAMHKKIDELLALYDVTFQKIHQERKLESTASKKKHFSALLDNFKTKSKEIYSDKK